MRAGRDRDFVLDWQARIENIVGNALPPRLPEFGDGLRLDWSDRWVQVRASNTEPIIRIIAEAPETKDAVKLIDQSMKIVAEAVKPFVS